MDITQEYALGIGVLLFSFLLIQFSSHIFSVLKQWGNLIRHILYRYVLHRYYFLTRLVRTNILLEILYIAGNSFCLSFRVANISQAGVRAGNLSLINLIPVYAGPHLLFLADILRIPLRSYQWIHRSAGLMSSVLVLFHALTVATRKPSFVLSSVKNVSAVVVRHS